MWYFVFCVYADCLGRRRIGARAYATFLKCWWPREWQHLLLMCRCAHPDFADVQDLGACRHYSAISDLQCSHFTSALRCPYTSSVCWSTRSVLECQTRTSYGSKRVYFPTINSVYHVLQYLLNGTSKCIFCLNDIVLLTGIFWNIPFLSDILTHCSTLMENRTTWLAVLADWGIVLHYWCFGRRNSCVAELNIVLCHYIY